MNSELRMHYKEYYGWAIWKKRRALSLSQTALGEMTGHTTDEISKIEWGRFNFNSINSLKLIQAVGFKNAEELEKFIIDNLLKNRKKDKKTELEKKSKDLNPEGKTKKSKPKKEKNKAEAKARNSKKKKPSAN
ncbi:MAG: hypothetical protein LUH18_08640 [Oscillospiraceae bacterium]|nr:hypothetical protein [Oscillospiraceae bacterium]